MTNIEQLERRANRYRNALMVLVLGLCAVAVIGATTDDGVLRGRQLFIQDAAGRVLLRAGADEAGDGLLTVMSKRLQDVCRP